MASRSTQVHFFNNTEFSLAQTGSGLSHGIWTQDDTPPQTIEPKAQNIQWGSESDGLATGTEGWVEYQLTENGEKVKISWDNPYAGSNAYNCNVPAGFDYSLKGGGEDNANVTFTFFQK